MIFVVDVKLCVPGLVGTIVSKLLDKDVIVDWKVYSGILILLF